MRFNLIFAICPADKRQDTVDAAKSAGATGATILSARGTGHKEAKTFFGLALDKPQEAMVMLVEKQLCQKIMQAIHDAAGMKKPGNGICFSIPTELVMGLESQLSVIKREEENLL